MPSVKGDRDEGPIAGPRGGRTPTGRGFEEPTIWDTPTSVSSSPQRAQDSHFSLFRDPHAGHTRKLCVAML
jgi:hypothetical protein